MRPIFVVSSFSCCFFSSVSCRVAWFFLWATWILISKKILKYHCCYMMVSCSHSSPVDQKKKRLLFWFFFFLLVGKKAARTPKEDSVLKFNELESLLLFLRSSPQVVTPRAYKTQTTNVHALHTHKYRARSLLFLLFFSVASLEYHYEEVNDV